MKPKIVEKFYLAIDLRLEEPSFRHQLYKDAVLHQRCIIPYYLRQIFSRQRIFLFFQPMGKGMIRSLKLKCNWKRAGMLLLHRALKRAGAGFPQKFWNRVLWRISWLSIPVCLFMDQLFGDRRLPSLQLPGVLVFREAKKQTKLKSESQGGLYNFRHSSTWLKTSG